MKSTKLRNLPVAVFSVALAWLMIAVGFPGYVLAQQGVGQNQNFDKVDVRVLPVQNNIYMLVGAGGNITAQVGKDGILLVDTQFAEMAPKVVAALRKLSDKPISILSTRTYTVITQVATKPSQRPVPPLRAAISLSIYPMRDSGQPLSLTRVCSTY